MRIRCIVAGLAVLGLGLGGCASQGGGSGGGTGSGGNSSSLAKTTVLQVLGPPGTECTTHYRAGSDSDTVTTTLTKRTPMATVVRLAGDDLECDIRKKDKAKDLSVEIVRDGFCLFRTRIKPGTQGVRLTRFWGGWKAEEY